MNYRLFNTTTGKLVRNEDGHICEFETREEADFVLSQVNEIKKLNPDHANDKIVISPTFVL